VIDAEQLDEPEQPDGDDPHVAPHGPFRDGRVWVLSEKCATCIFRPGNRMHLAPGRVRQMVAACIEQDTVISCHETYDGARSVCRGLYDVHRRDITIMRMAAAFDILSFDPPPADQG
jgi:hypothetical protein